MVKVFWTVLSGLSKIHLPFLCAVKPSETVAEQWLRACIFFGTTGQLNEDRSIERLNWTVQYFYPHSILKALCCQVFYVSLWMADGQAGQSVTKPLKSVIENGEIATFEPFAYCFPENNCAVKSTSSLHHLRLLW